VVRFAVQTKNRAEGEERGDESSPSQLSSVFAGPGQGTPLTRVSAVFGGASLCQKTKEMEGRGLRHSKGYVTSPEQECSPRRTQAQGL
jgi:hypothetical protein